MPRKRKLSTKEAVLMVRERSEALGLLRQACISMFKMMSPGNLEAKVERHRVYDRFLQAMEGRERLTVISLSFVGKDDLLIEGFIKDENDHPIEVSGLDLLVQREGSDAFLDPKQAIKVVRRKYAMMNLVNSMNMMMGRRNIFSFTIERRVLEQDLLAFCDLMHREILEDREEEEQVIRRGMSQFTDGKIRLYLTDTVVGQSLKLPWRLKIGATLLRERLRRMAEESEEPDRDAQLDLIQYHAASLSEKELKVWILLGDRFQDAFDPYFDRNMVDTMIPLIEERTLANILISLLDTFHELRTEHLHRLGKEDEDAAPIEDRMDSFVVGAGKGEEIGERLLLHAKALDRIQELIGRTRFLSLAKAKRAENFQREAREGQSYDALKAVGEGGDEWDAAIQQAYGFSDPAYRAKALVQLAERMLEAGETEKAHEVLTDAFVAADDIDHGVIPILAELLTIMLQAEMDDLAEQVVFKGLEIAHDMEDDGERATSLMLITSSLLQGKKVPANVRRAYTESILGEDLGFWDSPVIQGSLVEAIMSQMDPESPHTDVLRRKLLTHPSPQLRQSAIRMIPLDDEEYKPLILSMLEDDDAPEVRIEVMERLGYTGDPRHGVYLLKALRNRRHELNATEKKVLAINLARIDPHRYLSIFNLMLGSLATETPNLLGNQRPFEDDPDLQLAALEVLFRINNRESRRILWNAAQKAEGEVAKPFEWAWNAIKRKPYGEPEIPKSRLDPEWTEEDDVPLLDLIRPEEDVAEREAAHEEEPSGLLGKLRVKARRLVERELPHIDRATSEEETEGEGVDPVLAAIRERVKAMVPGEADDAEEPAPRAPILMAVRALLKRKGLPVEDLVDVHFRLYPSPTASAPLWEETHERLLVRDGELAVVLGTRCLLPERLPEELFLGIRVQGSLEMRPRIRIWRGDKNLLPAPVE